MKKLSDQEARDQLLPDIPIRPEPEVLSDFKWDLCECGNGFIGRDGLCEACDLSDHITETKQLWDSFSGD